MSQPTATPPCACRAVNLAYGGCVGQYVPCTIRCRAVEMVGSAREARQPSCWEKTGQPADNHHARIDAIRQHHQETA